MTTPFHNTVDNVGMHFEDRILTMVLNSAIVKADEGKPVTMDSAANRVKLAGDGDSILGKLAVMEDRTNAEGQKLGSIEFNYVAKWPVKASDPLAIGDTAIGAGSGEIRQRTAAVAGSQSGTTPFAVTFPVAQEAIKIWGNNIVTAVAGGFATVMKM